MIFDLIAAHQPSAGPSVWTPAALFTNGELGFWLDSSDYSTLFQDSAGTTPVTGTGQPIGKWKNKVGQVRFDFIQATAAARPLSAANSGKPCVRYDGVDDQLATNNGAGSTITNNGFTLALGQKRTTNPPAGTRAFYGANGSVIGLQNQIAGYVFAQGLGQTLNSAVIISLTTANVLMSYAGIGLAPITVRLNGTVATGTSAPTSGTIGDVMRIVGGPENNCDISQAVFINRILTPAEITLLETYIAGKQ